MQDSNDNQLIEISEQPIPLCKLLKIANLVSGGGEAKIVISAGYVLLNNEVEYQKRKKVYENDIVEFNGESIRVIINANSKPAALIKTETTPLPKTPRNKLNNTKTHTDSSLGHEISPGAKSGRRSISF